MTHARTVWEEGREPGRQVVALGTAVSLTAVLVDLAITDEVTVLFDLVFVLLCVFLALDVRPADFFTAGVLPPLLMTGVFAMLGLTRPTTLGEKGDGAVQAVISGLSHHSEALVTGYAVCLAVLLIRAQVLSQRATRNDPGPRLRA
ncbi:MAG: DUF6542 domain-containing protein [Nocardioides sp.]